MRYFIVTFLVIGFRTLCFGCSCAGIDSTNVNEWIEQADIVIEGEYLTNINFNDEFLDRRNSQKLGYDILFRVTSVIKGSLSNDTVAVIQFDNGSCLQTFEQGEKYIVFGTEILNFVCDDNESQSVQQNSNEEIPPNELPPPGSYINDEGTMIYYNCNEEEINYWNSYAKNYRAFYTSYCSTFDSKSKPGKLIKGE